MGNISFINILLPDKLAAATVVAMTSATRNQGKGGGVDYTDRQYWSGLIKMSLSKFFILAELQRRPMHGYEIARQVELSTKGCCAPTAGALYPVLREFEEGGYVTALIEHTGGRQRKVYTITDKGQRAFAVAVEAWREVGAYLDGQG
ncbi:Transcriptional regulator PadR-like family protein [Magnetospirillum gryphiswaldense MSR-1 v2]|uniref:Transcriptional regulator PadR-like family protein n=1 Tax=Magnetospirillum gryphiswaldense (strain DSM 6361 / JCM 21280 / NBRC 15271 / MSR-1) TaxID=431944 RepID=V6F3F8_MAGGM|nr:Transcriptional regulator PadR-like family protein [Magnetospirillum gryphiswaldense MSR-1 v2]